MDFSVDNLILPATPDVSNICRDIKRQTQMFRPPQPYKVLQQENLEEVRRILTNTMTQRPLECFKMIDSLQNLSIDYHFQEEIQSIINTHYKSLMDDNVAIISEFSARGLYNASLCFRVFRQNGYPVSTEVFNRFLDKNGNLGEQVNLDLEGLIGLYQASQFVMKGEELLDQANAFTTKKLCNCIPRLNQAELTIVSQALDNPYHKTLARFNVKNYITAFDLERGLYGPKLREFAKTDFDMVQSLHQNELHQVSLWWKNLGLSQRLTFARDQPVKWHMWSMATLADPFLSTERVHLTKPISLVYLMDDIFDVYGTLHELTLFTEAINKWEVNDTDNLPYPMRIFLKALFDLTEETSYEIRRKHGWDPVNSLKRAWMRLCNAFLMEVKWFASGHLPGSEEYLENGVISSGVHAVFVHIFFLLGEAINQESVDLVDNIPGILSHAATILRLWDDLGSAKDENQQGYDGSYIECYRNEHNSTTEDAREHAVNKISDTWKKLNKEYLSPTTPFPWSFKKATLNFARMVQLMYNYDENQRLPILEKHMKALLYESIHVPRN